MNTKLNTGKRLGLVFWDEVKELHKKGYSYRDLERKFKISKGTISYHLSEGQKQKTIKRTDQRRKRYGAWIRKIEEFFRPGEFKTKTEPKQKRPKRSWYNKVRNFHRDKNDSTKGVYVMNIIDKVTEFFWKDSKYPFPYYECKYTGDKINVEVGKDHKQAASIDHRIPRGLGGSNDIEKNGSIIGKIVNEMKKNLSEINFLTIILKVAFGSAMTKHLNKLGVKIRMEKI